MHISKTGLRMIEQFEGFSSRQYDDGTGVMTIGYGTTSADVSPLPTHITHSEAEAFLARQIAVKYEPAVNALDIAFNQNEFDALCSFVYNLGPAILGPSHTIGQLLRAHDMAGAANSMLEYSDPGTSVHAGLLARRESERRLFLTPWKNTDPNHYVMFDRANRDMGEGRRANERETVQEYDRKRRHPAIFKRRLKRLRDNLRVLVKRLDHEIAMEPQRPDKFNRRWRRNQMEARAAGRRMA